MPKQVKKSPKKKDPNAPKRALSAFMLFSQEKRSQIKTDNPDATFGQIGKLLGDAWKSASESEKAPFLAKAEKEKEKYAEAMKKYKNSNAEEEEED
jgi:hypothetical protein